MDIQSKGPRDQVAPLSATVNIRGTTMGDARQILALYKRVAAVPGGIARLEHEIDDEYVRSFMASAMRRGVALVAVNEFDVIVAEIHAYRPDPQCFSHVLSDLTVVVDPGTQGNGVGRAIFETFLQVVTFDYLRISRIELIARQSNLKALKFYETLGFRQEGKLLSRIKNQDGSLESDIPMAWTRAA